MTLVLLAASRLTRGGPEDDDEKLESVDDSDIISEGGEMPGEVQKI